MGRISFRVTRPRSRTWSIALLSAFVLTCSPGCGNPVRPEDEDLLGLRYNEVMFKQTHNSYDRSFDWVKSLDFYPDRPYYGGVSGLEFDLLPYHNEFWDPDWKWGWNVGHWDGLKTLNKGTFASFLSKLEDWSVAHPGHRVITVMLELKNVDGSPDQLPFNPPGFPSWYRTELPDRLDNYILENLDRSRIFTPGDLMGKHTDLVAAAQAKGWPTLKQLENKFIFVLHGQRSNSKHGPAEFYSENPKLRLCFESFSGDQPSASTGKRLFWRMASDDPHGSWTAKALWAATQPGFITRAWPEGSPPFEDDKNDNAQSWAHALAYGVNMIATNQSSGSKWAMVGQEPFWPIPHTIWKNYGAKVSGGVTREWPPDGTTTQGVAAAEFQGKVYLVYGNTQRNLAVSTGDMLSFAAKSIESFDTPVEGQPAAAVFDNKLWVIFRGPQPEMPPPPPPGGLPDDEFDPELYWTCFDGSSWTVPAAIGTAMGSAGVAVLNRNLFVVYPDVGSRLQWRRWTGNGWSGPESVLGAYGVGPIAACTQGDVLRIFYRKPGGTKLYMATFNGSAWRDETCISDINEAQSSAGPTAALVDGNIEVVMNGASSGRIWTFSVNPAGHVSGLAIVPIIFTNDFFTDAPMGLVVHDSTPYLFYKWQFATGIKCMQKCAASL